MPSPYQDLQVLIETLPTISRTELLWPDLAKEKVTIKPPRVGVDRKTFKVIYGWDHVVQSLQVLFMTPFHQRVLYQWVGSFVPHLLGDNATERMIGRFYWAISTSADLFEPNYRIQRVNITSRPDGTNLNSIELFRQGYLQTINEGVYRPRAHLGDTTVYQRRKLGLIANRGPGTWEPANAV